MNVGEHDFDVLLLDQIRVSHRQRVQWPFVILGKEHEYHESMGNVDTTKFTP